MKDKNGKPWDKNFVHSKNKGFLSTKMIKKSFSIIIIATAISLSGCAQTPLLSAQISSPSSTPVSESPSANIALNPTDIKNNINIYSTSKKPLTKPKKIAYLTFDDGPNYTWTPQILDILKKYKAQATFFVLGNLLYDKTNISLAQREIKEGHSVQNHSWDHESMLSLGYDSRKHEIVDTNIRILEITGVSPKCFRPPYGATNSKVKEMANDNGLDISLWDVDTRDWEHPGADALVEHVATHTNNNSIILFHDGGGSRQDTVDALPAILEQLSGKGFEFKKSC